MPHPPSNAARAGADPAAPSSPTYRALLFDSERGSRELRADALDEYVGVPDTRLLWVNAVVADGAPEALGALGVDPARLDPDAGGDFGLVIDGEWKYLHVRALNWHDNDRPVDVPIAVGIGPNVVVTVHRGPVDFIAAVLDNEADHLRVGGLEATSFATALIDRMLTDYLDARDAFESQLDRLELLILRRPRSAYLAELQRLRHLASKLRRYLAAQRDLFDALARPDFDPSQSESAQRHCRALSARYSQVMQSIEAARELVNGSFDLYTSRAAESVNRAMHTLTVVTVAMGLAATIAGVLGMNFQARLFDTGERGFIVAASTVAAIVLAAGIWGVWRSLGGSR